jgi:hypothetical protein
VTPLLPLRQSRELPPRLAAARAAVIYLIFAALWIYASDRVLSLLVQDKMWLAWIGTIKGLVYVVVTTSLLYLLLRAWEQRQTEPQPEQARYSRPLVAVFVLLALLVPLLS